MAAPKGNQFWKARSSHGRDKLFASAEILQSACQEYFQWVEENPLYEDRPFAYRGDVTHESVPKMRAMTVEGLCIFLDMDSSTWRKWESDKDFFPVTRWAESVIRQQKFSGAAADLLNANIIARDLGLADKSELQNLDRNGHPTDPVIAQIMAILTSDQLDQIELIEREKNARKS